MTNIYNTKLTTTTLPSNYSISGSGGSGQVYTTNGTSALNWTTPNTQTQFNGGNGKPVMTMPNGTDEVILEKDATLEVKGKVKINGIDLEERLNIIERILMIPKRDATLEDKYPSLKKKFDDYINTLEKYQTFEHIKGE
jgi:hypothetical protein